MTQEKIYRAALIIIGNEILSGRTVDKNLPYIAEKLNGAGVRLSEVRVIPDIEDEIIAAVRAMSTKFDYVFTTGGIGPTHDDITSASVAKAFNVPLVRHPDAVKMLEDYYPEGQVTEARLTMADVPEGATLIPNPVSGAPGFKIENVHVMAGVPRIMQGMLDHVTPTLAGGRPVVAKTVEGRTGESIIAERLEAIAHDHPNLDIGSYPSFKNGWVSVALVVRGTDIAEVDEAVTKIVALLKDVNADPQIVGD